ncbi:MAG: hypothetical protein SGJ27_29630 [Candidatus Melainabacteria bacterium]|nr:hypothetical protein [Candidatus Melainabacteria bacterium]
MKSSHSNLIKNLLLSITLFMLAVTTLDFSHVYSGSGSDLCAGSQVAFESAVQLPSSEDSLFEELDDPDKPGTKRRMPVALANSISLKNTGNLDNSPSHISSCPLARPVPCPIEVKTVSWLEKEKAHLEVIKAQPLWLRFSVLLI